MSFEDLHAQGERTFASLVPGGEERLAQIFRVAPDLAETVVGTVYGHLHHRPALDPRTREAVALSAILATGMYGTPLAVQLRTGMASGLASAEIVEILLETAAFAGIPRAVSALPQVEESLGAAGRPVPPGPSPRQIVLDTCAEIRGTGESGPEEPEQPGRSEQSEASGRTGDTGSEEATGTARAEELPSNPERVDSQEARERQEDPAHPERQDRQEPSASQEFEEPQEPRKHGETPDAAATPTAAATPDADAEADADVVQEPAWRRSLRGLLADCPQPWVQTVAPDRALAVFGPSGDHAGQDGPGAVVHFRVSGTDVASAVVFTPSAAAPADVPSPSDAASAAGAPAPESPLSSASSKSSKATSSWSPASPSGPATLGRVLDYLRSTHPVPAETTPGGTRSVPDPDVLEDLEPVRFLLAQGARPVIREVDASHVTAAIPTGNGDTAVVLARLDDGAVTRVTVLHPGG